MAKSYGVPREVAEALMSLHIGNPSDIRRVVIDITAGEVIKIYVEYFGSEEVINVIKAIAQTEICIMDRPKRKPTYVTDI